MDEIFMSNTATRHEAYSGYNELYDPSRAPGPITAALCWAHARRQFFELADIAANARRGKNAAAISPIALEAVKRIDALFDIERGIKGQNAEQRLRVRQELSVPLVAALEAWLREQRSRLSSASSVAAPIDYMLRRWDRFTHFLDDRLHRRRDRVPEADHRRPAINSMRRPATIPQWSSYPAALTAGLPRFRNRSTSEGFA
jgi:hypothetical protein